MNKTFILVGQILSVINAVYLFIIFGLYGLVGMFSELPILSPIFLAVIATVITGVVQIQRYKDGKTTKDIANVWGAILVITGGIGGILILIGVNLTNKSNVGDSVEMRIKKLNTLYDRGLITQEEYLKRRKEILDNIV